MARYEGGGSSIFLNGEFVPEGDAKISVLSGAVKYAATVFEGMVAYLDTTGADLNVFRLAEHIRRLQQSMLIMRFDHEYDAEHLASVVLETLRHNDVSRDAHLRLSAFVEGHGAVDCRGPIGLACYVSFRPVISLEDKTARAAVSAWRRLDDAAMPPRIKCVANYNNGRLGLVQAKDDGYDEVIFLTQSGKVAEGSSACLFIVRDGKLVTPMTSHGILESITRDAIIKLLGEECGHPVAEREIDRTELYLADEAFFCGSGYEVTPVVSIDGIVLGDGLVGPVTRQAWQAYEQAVRGALPDRSGWLTRVHPAPESRQAVEAD